MAPMQSVTLRKHHRFQNVYNNGKSAYCALIVLIVLPNGRGVNRVGMTVSKKVGNAVTRNRVKRRLRHAYRLTEASFAQGFDIVAVARRGIAAAPFSDLTRSIGALAKKVGLTPNDGRLKA